MPAHDPGEMLTTHNGGQVPRAAAALVYQSLVTIPPGT